MKLLHWIALILAIAMATWFVYNTRNTMPRIDDNIDLNWRFSLGDVSGAESTGFNDS